jgi:signal transduction histidine kinase
VRIQRKSQGDVLWLVTLEQSVESRNGTSDLDARAVLTENIIEDLRIPLQEVLGWTSLLRRTRGDARRTGQALATIERNAELVIRLLEGLVEHSRRNDGRTPPPHSAHRVELGEAPRIDASHVI